MTRHLNVRLSPLNRVQTYAFCLLDNIPREPVLDLGFDTDCGGMIINTRTRSIEKANSTLATRYRCISYSGRMWARSMGGRGAARTSKLVSQSRHPGTSKRVKDVYSFKDA